MVNRILTVDQFNPKNVELWFSILESRFITAEVTDDIAKFHYVKGSLTADMLMDHIELNPYELLKKELIRVYSIKRRSNGNNVENNQIPREARTSSSPTVPPATSNQTSPAMNRPISPGTSISSVQPLQPQNKRKRVKFADHVDLTSTEPSPALTRSSAVESHVQPTRRVSGGPPVVAVGAGRPALQMIRNRCGTSASRSNGTLPTVGQRLPAPVSLNNHVNQAFNLTQPSTSSNIAYPSTSSNIAYPSTSSNIAHPSTSSNIAYPSTSSNIAYPSTSSNIAHPSTSSNFIQPSTSMFNKDVLSQALELLRRNGTSCISNSRSTNGRT